MIKLHFNNKKNIAENLRTLFANNTANVNYNSVFSNIIHAVILVRKVILHINYILSSSENDFMFWIKQLTIIVNELKEFFSQHDEHAFRLLRELKNEPKYSKFVDFYNLIIKKWTLLKNSFAFKFLIILVRLIILIYLKKYLNY